MTMTDWDRKTESVVADLRARLRARGVETLAAERWEGDGVWQVWVEGRPRSVHVGGHDQHCSPGEGGACLSAGDGGAPADCPTLEDAVAWLVP
jgi:hypothetical protein